MAARGEICKVIVDECDSKRRELNEKINDINSYLGPLNSITPDMFKGEQVKILDMQPIPVEEGKVKKEFDM